jgi:hypothetical protein
MNVQYATKGWTQKLIHTTYAEILSWAPNVEGGGQINLHTN